MKYKTPSFFFIISTINIPASTEIKAWRLRIKVVEKKSLGSEFLNGFFKVNFLLDLFERVELHFIHLISLEIGSLLQIRSMNERVERGLDPSTLKIK